MPHHGGKRPNAGRKKGHVSEPTRLRKEIAEKALSEGLSPLEYMLAILRDETQEQGARFSAAKEAAPYLHPKLASVEHKGDADNPLQVIGHIFGAALNGTGRVPVEGPDHDAEDDVRGPELAS